MNISQNTIDAIKSLASINNSIAIDAGSELSTVSKDKAIIAKIKVTDSFEKSFAIYDLSQFIGVISLFKDPEIEFNDSYLTVSSEGENVNYRYADKNLIITLPPGIWDKCEKLVENPSIEFKLTSETLARIQKAGAVLGVPEIAVVGEDGKITVRALNSKETDGNNYQFQVGETDIEFRAIFKTENLKVIPDDYTVVVAKFGPAGISKFTSDRAQYFISVESNSQFG